MPSPSSLNPNNPQDQQGHDQKASIFVSNESVQRKLQPENEQIDCFPELKEKIFSDSAQEKFNSMVTLRKLMEKDGTALYQRIIDEDLFSQMVDWIHNSSYNQLHLQIVKVIHEIFRCGTIQQCYFLTDIKIVDILSQLIKKTQSEEMVKLIAQSFERLLARDMEFCRIFRTAKPFKALICVLERQNFRDCHEICVKSLLFLCKSFPKHDRHAASKICFMQIAKILAKQSQYNSEIIRSCFQIYQAHAQHSHFLRKIIKGNRVRPVLVNHLEKRNEDTLSCCLNISCALIYYMPRNAINLGIFKPLDFLNYLSGLLSHGELQIRLASCEILNSISESILFHCSLFSLKNRPLFSQLLKVLEGDNEHLKGEICEIFEKLFHKTLPNQRMLALRKHVIKLGIECLHSQNNALIKKSLSMLYRIFQTHDASIANFIQYKGLIPLQKLKQRNDSYFFIEMSKVQDFSKRQSGREIANQSESLRFPHHGSSESSSQSLELLFSRSEYSSHHNVFMENHRERSRSESSS